MFFFNVRTQGDVCTSVYVESLGVMTRRVVVVVVVVVFLLCCSVLIGNIWLDFPFER